MTEYLINDDTNKIIEKTSNLGRWFSKAPWRLATQPEVDAYLLGLARDQKYLDLKSALYAFLNAGHLYQTKTYLLSDNNCSNISLTAALPGGTAGEFEFCDIDNELVDFVDSAGFTAFADSIRVEKDRVMKKYNAYKVEIRGCATIADINAITIDFSV